ncbi:MAG: hypothetical protein L0312_05370 [Acidobacteria bacterium]|nr:hypothetical protein [Acidobacteriota bacterium]
MAFGGSLPIPMTAVVEYARLYDFDDEQTEDLLYVVRHLDRTFLKHEEKQSKKDGGHIGSKGLRKKDHRRL